MHILPSYKSQRFRLTMLAWVIGCGLASAQDLPVIKASSSSAVIRLNNSAKTEQWGIAPEARPDVFRVPCRPGKTTKLSFVTDKDSMVFLLRIGDVQRFNVVLNGKDTALTELQGIDIPPAASFSDAYIRQNKGKIAVAIPETKELLQIVFAVTPTGLADTRSFIINHDSTEYYLEVIRHFLPYKDEPVVKAMDSLLKKGLYINLKMDICAFRFDKNNHIIFGDAYTRFNNSGTNRNFVEPYLRQLEAFAARSGFRKFYAAHKPFYDSLVARQRSVVPLKQMWTWLEAQFPIRYQSYRVYLSPLVKGNHSANSFEDRGFRESHMFIRPPVRYANVNEKVSEALNSRIVFTEIDENYVDPYALSFVPELNRIFNQRKIWANGKESNGYNTPYNLFTEYTTWAVYVLYCSDYYNATDFELIRNQTVRYMIQVRGFPVFEAFTDKLLSLYKSRKPGETVAQLFPALLQWCAAETNSSQNK